MLKTFGVRHTHGGLSDLDFVKATDLNHAKTVFESEFKNSKPTSFFLAEPQLKWDSPAMKARMERIIANQKSKK